MEGVPTEDDKLLPGLAYVNKALKMNNNNLGAKGEQSSFTLEESARYDENDSLSSNDGESKLLPRETSNGVEDEEGSDYDEDLEGEEPTSDDHHNNSDLPLICFECGETFDDKESFHLHVKSHNLPFKCSICEEGFTDRDDLIQHALIHANDKTVTNMPAGYENFRSNDGSTCPKRRKRKYTRNNFDPNTKECPICHKVFSTVYVMKNHMEIHAGIKEHKCDICGKTFSAKRYLTKHVKTHSEEKPYKCSVCEKAFRTAYYLRVHTRLHTGDLPFGCMVCGKSFNVVTELKVHMRNHTGDKPYTCSICGMAFAAASYLRTHMRIHTGEKPFECRLCGRRFGRSNGLKTHMAIHTNHRPHMCRICDKGFARPDELKSHVYRIHKRRKVDGGRRRLLKSEGFDRTETGWEYGAPSHNEDSDTQKMKTQGMPDKTQADSDDLGEEIADEETFVSSDLDAKTTEHDGDVGVGKNGLKRNMGKEEKDEIDWDEVDEELTEEEDHTIDSSEDLGRKLTEHHLDTISNLDKVKLEIHENGEGDDEMYKNTDGLERSLDGEDIYPLQSFKKEDFSYMTDSKLSLSRKETPTENEITVICHICDTVIDEVRDLIITANGERHLECSKCKTISNHRPTHVPEVDMTKIITIEHTEPPGTSPTGRRKRTRSNICPICKKEFAPTYLKVHMEIHSGLKPYKCGVCGKMFNARRYLTKHLETHKEIKKHRCDICDRTFGSKYYLKIHTSVHTGQKEFSCEICGKQFNIRPELKTHMRVHTGEKPFSCSMCDRAFISTAYLRSHMKTHTGERNHECPLCDKKFSRSNDLKIHISTHTGDRPYQCVKCGKGFNRSGEIDAHMKSFHAIDDYNYFHNGEKESSSDGIVSLDFTPKKFEPDALVCNICGKAFDRKIHLKAHMKTHSGDRPFSCYVCQKTFPDNWKLKCHLKVHEKEASKIDASQNESESSPLEMSYDNFDYRIHLPEFAQQLSADSKSQQVS